MQVKEEKLCSFTQKGTRLQLIKINRMYEQNGKVFDDIVRYQVRLNRKILDTSLSEYTERKLFAQMVQNIVLQLKIY